MFVLEKTGLQSPLNLHTYTTILLSFVQLYYLIFLKLSIYLQANKVKSLALGLM